MGMNELTEKTNVTYSCGCVHEIGRKISGAWCATGKNKNCKEHS